MKVLFVSSGNSGKISPITKAQGESLKEAGVDITFFLIDGRGLSGYIKNIPLLRHKLRETRYDLIHAHFALSAYAASLASAQPLVVSLMGSDVKKYRVYSYLNKLLKRYSWKATIVKSEDMKSFLGKDDVHVIPNGVDLSKFKKLDQAKCKVKLGWKSNKTHILFAAQRNRHEKNYALFERSIDLIKAKYPEIETYSLDSIKSDEMPIFYNAADVVCLSSKWEGSPNVIKEAMSCNRPIVTTKVGDIEWLFGNEPGHYLTSFDPEDVALKIQAAIEFSKKVGQTDGGRQRIIELGLDSERIAKKLVAVYDEVLQKK